MIKANELRLNNMVLFAPVAKKTKIQPRVVTIIKIGQDSCVVNDNGLPIVMLYNSDEIQPIVLNEDRLKDFEFEESGESERYYHPSTMLFDIINTTPLGKGYYRWKAVRGENLLVSNELKYIHQLQNFFFASTGEELQQSLSRK